MPSSGNIGTWMKELDLPAGNQEEARAITNETDFEMGCLIPRDPSDLIQQLT
jgi:hypothetical protein